MGYAGHQGPGYQGPGSDQAGQSRSSWDSRPDRFGVGAGLAVSALGLVLVALNLFAFKWADVGQGTFLDLSSNVRRASGSGGDTADKLARAYIGYLAFVLCGVTAVWAVLSGVPVPRSAFGNNMQRVVGTVIAGVAAVLHTLTVVRVFRGPSAPEIGAWLAVVGYFISIVGMTLGARRIRTG